MKTDLEQLLELQQVTAELRRQRERVAAYSRRLQEIELASKRMRAENAEREAKLGALKKEWLEGELELKTLEEKLSGLRKRSAVVRTPKECEALEHEIATLEEKRSKLEERLLVLMEEAERLEKAEEQKKKEERDFTAELVAERERLIEAHKQSSELIKVLTADEARMLQALGDPIAQIYSRLVTKAELPVVARVEKSTCSGCGTQLPIHLVQSLKTSGEVELCPHCHRLVYVDTRAHSASDD